MLGTNANSSQKQKEREKTYPKRRLHAQQKFFINGRCLSVNVQNPFCSREGAQRPSYAQVRTIETRLFPYPFSRQEFQLPSIRRATRFVQPGETSTANKNNFRDCLWLRDRINIAESKVSWRKHGVANCVSYTHVRNRI